MYLFVEPWSANSGGRSIRDILLHRSEQRAHSAKVAAARIKEQRLRNLRRSRHRSTSLDVDTRIPFKTRAERPRESEPTQPSDESADVIPIHHLNSSAHLQHKISPHAQPVITHGNSDPFDCAPIPITSEVNRVVVFARDVFFLANRWPRHLRKGFSKQLKTTDTLGVGPILRTVALAAASPDSFIAFIACYAICLALVLPSQARLDFQTWALDMKAHAIRRLRVSVANYRQCDRPNPCLVRQILFLFLCECQSHSRASAASHVHMLRSLLDATNDPETKINGVVMAVQDDVELASFTMQPTLLDHEIWYPAMMGKFWTDVEAALPQFPPSAFEIPTCITHRSMKQAMINLRRGIHLAKTVLQQPGRTQAEESYQAQVYRWWATLVASDLGNMLNLSLTLSKPGPMPPSEESHDRCFSATIAFTIFCSIRKYVREGVFDGIDFQDASHILAPKLKSLLEMIPQERLQSSSRDVQGTIFWIYFTGALFEQTSCSYQRQSKGKNYWFTQLLTLRARKLGLLSWDSAKKTLDSFVFSDCLEPHPSLWYELLFVQGNPTMSESLPREDTTSISRLVIIQERPDAIASA